MSWIWAARAASSTSASVASGRAKPGSRRVEQVGLLRDDADRGGEGAEGQLAHVDVVEPHGPGAQGRRAAR